MKSFLSLFSLLLLLISPLYSLNLRQLFQHIQESELSKQADLQLDSPFQFNEKQIDSHIEIPSIKFKQIFKDHNEKKNFSSSRFYSSSSSSSPSSLLASSSKNSSLSSSLLVLEKLWGKSGVECFLKKTIKICKDLPRYLCEVKKKQEGGTKRRKEVKKEGFGRKQNGKRVGLMRFKEAEREIDSSMISSNFFSDQKPDELAISSSLNSLQQDKQQENSVLANNLHEKITKKKDIEQKKEIPQDQNEASKEITSPKKQNKKSASNKIKLLINKKQEENKNKIEASSDNKKGNEKLQVIPVPTAINEKQENNLKSNQDEVKNEFDQENLKLDEKINKNTEIQDIKTPLEGDSKILTVANEKNVNQENDGEKKLENLDGSKDNSELETIDKFEENSPNDEKIEKVKGKKTVESNFANEQETKLEKTEKMEGEKIEFNLKLDKKETNDKTTQTSDDDLPNKLENNGFELKNNKEIEDHSELKNIEEIVKVSNSENSYNSESHDSSGSEKIENSEPKNELEIDLNPVKITESSEQKPKTEDNSEENNHNLEKKEKDEENYFFEAENAKNSNPETTSSMIIHKKEENSTIVPGESQKKKKETSFSTDLPSLSLSSSMPKEIEKESFESQKAFSYKEPKHSIDSRSSSSSLSQRSSLVDPAPSPQDDSPTSISSSFPEGLSGQDYSPQDDSPTSISSSFPEGLSGQDYSNLLDDMPKSSTSIYSPPSSSSKSTSIFAAEGISEGEPEENVFEKSEKMNLNDNLFLD